MISPGNQPFSNTAERVRATAARLDDAITVLAESHLPGMSVVAEALALYRSGWRIEDAFGFPNDWREMLQADRRRAAYRQLADTDFPHHSDRKFARALISAAATYQRAGGTAHLREGRRPDGQQGRLYDLLMTGPLPGFEKLRKEINALCGYENAVSRTQKNQDRGCSTKEPS